MFTSASPVSTDGKAVTGNLWPHAVVLGCHPSYVYTTVLENDDPEEDEEDAWENETNAVEEEGVWMEEWEDEAAVQEKEADFWEQEADVQREVATVWKEEADVWEKEADLQEHETVMWKEMKGNVQREENEEWEDDSEETMEEERCIRVLHNRLKREEFLEVTLHDQLSNSAWCHSLHFINLVRQPAVNSYLICWNQTTELF